MSKKYLIQFGILSLIGLSSIVNADSSSSSEYSHKMGTSSRYSNANGQTTKDQDYQSITTVKEKRKSVFTNQEQKPFVPHPDYYNYQYLAPTTNSFSN